MINYLTQAMLAFTCLTCTAQVTPFEYVTPQDISDAAMSLYDPTVWYNPAYQNIGYPMGDVPADQGVCTDVVVRTLRKVGVDLQVEIANMRRAQGKSVDPNIDHRRVPNIMEYLEKSPEWEATGPGCKHWEPGDIIWWKIDGTVNHVGVVVEDNLVMHNIGRGQVNDVEPWRWRTYVTYRLKK